MVSSALGRVVFVLLFCSAALSPQQVKTVILNGKPVSLGIVMKNGEVFVSAADAAGKAGIRYYENSTTRKIEFIGSSLNVKLTAGSPFAVISRASPDTVFTLQMPAAVHFAQGAYYLPWKSFSRLLSEHLNCRVGGEPEVAGIGGATTPKDTQKIKTAALKDSTGQSGGAAAEKRSLQVSVDEKANGTLVKLSSKLPFTSYSASLAGNKLSLFFSPAALPAQKIPPLKKKSVIRKMSVSAADTAGVVVFELTDEYANHEVNAPSPNMLQVVLQNKKFVPADKAKKDKWKFDAIVIDAGHGGKDYGAIGVDHTVEKEINLAVALKFGELVKQNLSDVKVIYTRDDDTFVELYRRGQIANESGGKLFVSIHCNSVPGRSGSATGFEIYLLRPGRTAEAISIAARENAVISYEENPDRYQKLTDENLILVSMAHASYMKYSEKFADFLNQHLAGSVPLRSRGVKQAGFLVLVGASMPSILFETGYVSNERDAAYLRSSTGQQELAEALLRAVQSFKAFYTTELEGQ